MSEPENSDPSVSADPLSPSTDWFWTELDLVRGKWDVVEHPYYVRWLEGSLSPDDLATHAEEHDRLVRAVAGLPGIAAAKAPDGILRDLLQDEAREEDRRLALWRRFVRAVGWETRSAWHFGAEPEPETLVCSRAWAGDPSRPLAWDVVTLYALRASLPPVIALERTGLLRRYGFADDGATAYFADHPQRREESTARIRAGLAGLLGGEDCLGLLRQVESVHLSHWQMLDGLQRRVLR